MQSALQSNPNLSLQRCFELHRYWVQGFLNNPPPANQTPQAPANPQIPPPQYNQRYNGWYILATGAAVAGRNLAFQ